jgi:hypothetical protein
LERILGSEHFRSSGRYPALLRHIVERALKGNTADLKERSIGIEVFHRESDYNTADDPVVRVCGSEVRRRLALYYQQSQEKRALEIELPAGGYQPHFWRTASKEHEESTHEQAGLPVPQGNASEVEPAGSVNGEKGTHWNWFVPFAAGALVSLLVGTIFLAVQKHHEQNSPIMQVWGPLLDKPDPVLISVGRPHPSAEAELTSPVDLSVESRILIPSYRVSITAVSAISDVAGFLETRQKRFRVHESDSSELDDLHKRPVVLINANDNKWTVQFLKQLRFHMASGIDGEGSYSYVVDEQHPGRRDWRVNWDQPYLKQTADYAIVGRFYCPTTEGPVVVIAGISSTGTEAGGEFMVSPEALETLARTTRNSLGKNFEAVLRVEVVGGKTGAVKVLDSQFW